MTPELWAEIESLFETALSLEQGARTAFLADTNPALRAQVESLLAEHDAEPGFLESPVWLANDVADQLPERVGNYRILGTVGRGGMGQVYLAEREAPGFRQRVALKVMRRGMDTDDLIARFRAERQILASLDHPNIAKLLDVGSTESGLPHFVMEYVDGVALLDYCDAKRLDIDARLQLFGTICDAVHHAHRRLVIHRDLKPQNILVTADGVPKLLDFGIAKILNPAWHEIAAHTQAEHRLLTPDYSAPEQLRGDAVTTAADVYALGVLLYELLVGVHPIAGERARLNRLEDALLAPDHAAPSSVVTESAAAARALTAAQLQRRLRGDLDAIVATAMQEDPSLRYDSALALRADLGRHLAGKPIVARPVTFAVRARKFVARNPLVSALVSVMLLLITSASVVTLYQSQLLRAETTRVQRERDKAVQVRGFLLEMFGTTGPDQATGDSVTARQLLDRRAATLATMYADDVELQAELSYVLAEGYEKLGLYGEAERHARDALAVRQALPGVARTDVAASLNQVGWLLHQRRRFEESETVLRDAIAVGRAAAPPHGDAGLARALNDLGVVLEARGRPDEAAAAYRESLAMRRRVLGDRHIGVATTSSNLAVILYRQGQLDSAVAMADTALQLFRAVLGPDHARTMITQNNLAAFQAAMGDRAGAARQHRDLLERRRRLLGEQHPYVALSMANLANELFHTGAHAEAEALLREAAGLQRRSADTDDDLAATLLVLGDVLGATGRDSAALASYVESLTLLRGVHGDAHPNVVPRRVRIARAHARLGDYARAAAVATEAMRSLGDAIDARALRIRLDLIDVLLQIDRLAEAQRAFDVVARAAATPASPLPAQLTERIERMRAVMSGE